MGHFSVIKGGGLLNWRFFFNGYFLHYKILLCTTVCTTKIFMSTTEYYFVQQNTTAPVPQDIRGVRIASLPPPRVDIQRVHKNDNSS